MPLFDTLDSAILNAVNFMVEEVQVNPNEVIFDLGQPANSLYIVKEGTILLQTRV